MTKSATFFKSMSKKQEPNQNSKTGQESMALNSVELTPDRPSLNDTSRNPMLRKFKPSIEMTEEKLN